MKHNIIATANATAITVGLIYVACAALVVFLPGIFKTVSGSWFHGIDLSIIWTGQLKGNLVLGFLTATGGGWSVGYVFAVVYNRFVK